MEEPEIEPLLDGPPRITLEQIVSHPRLPEARKVYIDRFLDIYGSDPFLVRLLIESGRFLIYHITVVLEAAQDPARPETWPTVGLLKKTMAPFGLASGRHIDDLIGRLCAVGYMELKTSDQDRRVRIISPTDKMRSHDRDWLSAHYAPLAILYPHHDYELVLQRDPNFHAVHRGICMQLVPLAAKLYVSIPDMMLFLNRAAGYVVIAALLQAAMAQPDSLHSAVPYGDVGDRFGVSRTHVRKLLVAAEEAGLVKLHGRGGRMVEILPRLWTSHDRAIAGGMYGHDLAYVAAHKVWLETGLQTHIATTHS
jgi:hypothetical protein